MTGNEAVVVMEDVPMDGYHQDPPLPNNQGTVVIPDNSPHATCTYHYDNMNGRSNRELLLGVMRSVYSLRRTIIEHGNSIETLRGGIRKQEHTMSSLVRKIDVNPLQQLQ